MPRSPISKFQPQYDPTRIHELAAEDLASPYRGGTYASADQAMENAGNRIVNGISTRLDANVIYEWKSPRRMDVFGKNSDADVAQALQDAINPRSVRKAVAALTRLEGVGVKMASAILTAMFPHKYTVLDFRSLHAMGVKNGESIGLYLHYLRACLYGAAIRGNTTRFRPGELAMVED